MNKARTYMTRPMEWRNDMWSYRDEVFKKHPITSGCGFDHDHGISIGKPSYRSKFISDWEDNIAPWAIDLGWELI